MILFISTQAHVNLLDFLIDEGYTIKKISGTFSLKKFVSHDIRNFTHCKELVLDRGAFSDEDEYFIEAIEEFLTMYDARVTVICQVLSGEENLMKRLMDIDVTNLVTQTDAAGIKNDIRECLSPEGMRKYISGEDTREAKYVFNTENIEIAVFGSQSRVGTTTVAVGMANWLSSVGAKVCYVEANRSKCLSFLIDAYEMEKKNDFYVYDGVYYQYDRPVNEIFNFIIYDMGVGIPNDSMNLNICLCGVKPYEIPYTIKIAKELNKREWKYSLLAVYAENEYVQSYKSIFPQMVPLFYQPDPLNGYSNKLIFREMIKEIIFL